jgi:actin-like protein 6A
VGDVDVRKELSNNIILTGGSSLFPNLDVRLSYELATLLPNFTRPKVIAPRFSVERSCAPWIGASILTSLGSFQQLWLSRTEYEEYGSTLAIQRFP